MMSKIPKNLSDSDMLTTCDKETNQADTAKTEQLPVVQPGYESGFLTPELTKLVGKALLELKVKLYKDGIIDYNIKVKQEGNQVIMTAAPRKNKPKPNSV
ncbi:hypothetical protein SDC9_22969 [bioreactor metagenome]|uniref:Uncharacterized protein n=1 Tax=bioreactor metagenome TaxID=1076179 RepID=A0A644UDQ5_9ZZZZ